MSWAGAGSRLMLLIARRYDLEHQIALISDHKYKLGSMISNLMNLKADSDPGSPQDKAMQAKIHMLYEAEKALEMRITKLNKQQEAIDKEEQKLDQMVSKNIDRFFQHGYGSGRA